MSEIQKESPKGLRRSERILIRMLSEPRSWSDYMEIIDALLNLHFHADSMREERKHIDGGEMMAEHIIEY